MIGIDLEHKKLTVPKMLQQVCDEDVYDYVEGIMQRLFGQRKDPISRPLIKQGDDINVNEADGWVLKWY